MALTRRQGRSARSRGAVAHPGTVTFEEKFRRAVRGRPWRPHARCRAPRPAPPHSGGRGGRRRPWRRSPAPRIAPRHPRLRAHAQSAPPSSPPCAAAGSRTRRAPPGRARYTDLMSIMVLEINTTHPANTRTNKRDCFSEHSIRRHASVLSVAPGIQRIRMHVHTVDAETVLRSLVLKSVSLPLS